MLLCSYVEQSRNFSVVSFVNRTLSNWVYEFDKWAPSVVKVSYKVSGTFCHGEKSLKPKVNYTFKDLADVYSCAVEHKCKVMLFIFRALQLRVVHLFPSCAAASSTCC